MRKKQLPSLLALLFFATPALSEGEVYLACTFETLPQAVLFYPNKLDAKPTMSIGFRPPVEMIVGSGSSRYESAQIDGYLFQFSPSNLWMDVLEGSKTIIGEQARCARIGGPVNTTPLSIAPSPETASNNLTNTETTPAEATGSWRVNISSSALDDSPTVVVRQQADRRVTDRFGNGGYPDLILRCLENTTSVYLIVGDLFLSDIQGYGRVDYRLDDDPKQHKNMLVSTDNKALGLWRGRSSIPFIKSMFGKNNIILRVTPYNDSPVEFSFDISGLEQAIKPLREACQW